MSVTQSPPSTDHPLKTNFVEKAVDLASAFDQLMAAIFSALIAGIVALLLQDKVSLWVGGSLFLAMTSFAMGIGHTLIHIAFMSKTLLLADAISNGVAEVPNPIETLEPTLDAYKRNQAYAQRAYASQLIYLIIGIAFGALAVLLRLWEYAWRAGVLTVVLFAALFVLAALTLTWRKTLRTFRRRTASANQAK